MERSNTRSRATVRRYRAAAARPLVLLLLAAALAAATAAQLGWEDAAEHAEERRPLSDTALAELVERFAQRVVDAAAGAASPRPRSRPPLDAETDGLLARLLDEVLAAPEESARARLVQAMGVVRPPPPTTPPSSNLTARRRSLLQNATPLSPLVPSPGPFTRDRGGRFGGWAQSFQLIFSNIFDYFLRGGLGFLVPIIGDTLAPLRRYNWVRDVGMAIDAPFSNVINANYLPLPQTTADLNALLLRVMAPWCGPEKVTPGYQVLAGFRAAALEVELLPWSCEVLPVVVEKKEDEKSASGPPKPALMPKKFAPPTAPPPLQRIAWETCTPSKLVVTLKPATFSGPYFSSGSYAGAGCAFAQPFGLASTTTLGADTAAVQLKLSRVGIDLVPTVVQFEASGRFFPWIAANIVNNGSEVTAREVAFTSTRNSSTGGGERRRRRRRG
jgi:hypothetical protein